MARDDLPGIRRARINTMNSDVLGLFGGTIGWRGLADGRTLILPASADSGSPLHLLHNDISCISPRYRCYNGLKVLGGTVLITPPFIMDVSDDWPPPTELLYRLADGTVVKAAVTDEVLANEMADEVDASRRGL